MGENRGSGIATDDSVISEETLSEDETLPTVCLLLGIKAGPGMPLSSCECDRALNEWEARPIDREPRSDSDGIVESCELH